MDACPAGAIFHDDENLGIQTDRCTGCGVCIAACTQAAISNGTRVEVVGKTATLICDRSADRRSAANVVCVHCLGLEQIAALYLQGARCIVVDTGDCGACDNQPEITLQLYVSAFNRLLASRGLAEVTIATADTTDARARPVQHEPDTVDAAKRRLLLAFVSRLPEDPPDGGKSALASILRRSPRETQTPLFAFVPVIDAQRCDGCGHCVAICQEKALILVKDKRGEESYGIESANCTNCGLCSDICPQNAIDIDCMVGAECSTVRLATYTCRSCGVLFHNPVAYAPATPDACHVCRQVRHHAKLFQVLE